jgi:hypothetical protein
MEMPGIVQLLAIVSTVIGAVSFGVALYRRITYRQTEVTQVDDVWVVTPARDAFRSTKKRHETKRVLDQIVQECGAGLVVDLTRLKLGFDEDGAFWPILSTYADLLKTGGGDMVLVSPPAEVRRSFEFEPVSKVVPMASSRTEAIEHARARSR